MTREEAIKYIEQHNHIDDVVKDMCIESLGKQIPKKVEEYIEKTDKYSSYYYLGFECPSCKGSVVGQPYRPNYCKHCGQALDWSEENDNRKDD